MLHFFSVALSHLVTLTIKDTDNTCCCGIPPTEKKVVTMFFAAMPVAVDHIWMSIFLILIASVAVASAAAVMAEEEDWGPVSLMTLWFITFVIVAVIGIIISVMLYHFAWADYQRTLTDNFGK